MKFSFKNSKAFTLAEITIVLVVIGILTAILMPIAFQSAPDENVLKFKKANETLQNAIRELVNSDKYYLNGDLGIKADGQLLNGVTVPNSLENQHYFCRTLSEVLNTKESKCDVTITNPDGSSKVLLNNKSWGESNGDVITQAMIDYAKLSLDVLCRVAETQTIKYNTTIDGVMFFETKGNVPFGQASNEVNGRYFGSPYEKPTQYDSNGFDIAYKAFCIDVDGIPAGVTNDKCINECPFGYGIRADGKILTGKRADEWLEKSVQKK